MYWFIVLFLGLAACTNESPPPTSVQIDATGYETAAELLSCLEGEAAVVSAHRGGPAPGYPENAIETFERTLSQVPALIETDVRETSDGVLVLLHDETVDRTTNGTGAIAQMTFAEARTLRLVDGEGQLTEFQIPTLTEALQAMRGRTILQLDVKRGVGLRKVVRAVTAANAEPHAAIITYSANGAIVAAETGPNVSVIANVNLASDIQDLASRGLSDDRLIAWTGIVEEPELSLYEALGGLDISTSGGALGAVDDAAERGDGSAYQELEAAGLDIIATDRPVAAARQLGVADLEVALVGCSV